MSAGTTTGGNDTGARAGRQATYETFAELAATHTVVPVWRELLGDLETPVAAFRKLGEAEGSVLLESVEHGERWGRYSFLGTDPFATLTARDGKVTYTDTFEAPRSGHTHEGQDLMGAKMMRLVSAVDGTVHRLVFNNATGNSITIKAADGWTYHYIHVNNDRPGTDDGQAARSQAFPNHIVTTLAAGHKLGKKKQTNAEAKHLFHGRNLTQASKAKE